MNKFLMLLRKDWRVNRMPVVALLLAGVGPYLMVSLSYLWERHEYYINPSFPESRPSLENCLAAGAGAGLMCIPFIAAIFGGNAFATERRDHSADFLGALPASRQLIILSKLIIAAGCLVPMYLLQCIVEYLTITERPPSDWYLVYHYFAFLGFGVLLFGISWLCSTFLERPAVSAAISVAIGVAGFFGAIILSSSSDAEPPFGSLEILEFVVGVGTVALGWVYYAGRVAP